MRFHVKVGGIDLGHWSACKNLKVELKVSRSREGGNYWYERLQPTCISYANIALERAVHPADSRALQAWLAQVASRWMNYDGTGEPYAAQTATITLFGAAGQQVMDWELSGVYPVSWSGPALGAMDNKVAIETLELAHEGFLKVPSP
jgi:phage tail-like protein